MKIQNKILSLVITFNIGISGVVAKTSSNVLKDQQPKIRAVISKCEFKDTKILETVKGMAIGSSVTSAIATAGSVTSTVTSGMAAHKAGKNIEVNTVADREKAEDKNKSLKNLRLASLIGAGVATGANLTTLSLSAASANKLKDLITETDECMKAIEEVNLEEVKE